MDLASFFSYVLGDRRTTLDAATISQIPFLQQMLKRFGDWSHRGYASLNACCCSIDSLVSTSIAAMSRTRPAVAELLGHHSSLAQQQAL